MDNTIKELLGFLDGSSRIDLKTVALNHVLGLTGTKEGMEMCQKTLESSNQLLEKLVHLLTDPCESVAKDSSLALINLSANPVLAQSLLFNSDLSVVKRLWDLIADPECSISDPCCMIASNLTIDKTCCDAFLSALDQADITIEKFVFIFCQEGFNKKGAKLNYLAPVLSNLSQLKEMRDKLLDKDKCVIQRLLSYTEYPDPIRRGGIIGTLRNCCFDESYHSWLLGPSVEILPKLLLPLAGPTPEELDPEDIESLPLDLQYLDEDKKIESDPDIRKMLLESILQLCATRECREIIRKNSAYFILKEFHKIEEDKVVKLACENLVDILIKTEDEIKIDNYKNVSVPESLVPELEDMDKEYLKD